MSAGAGVVVVVEKAAAVVKFSTVLHGCGIYKFTSAFVCESNVQVRPQRNTDTQTHLVYFLELPLMHLGRRKQWEWL